MTQPTATIVSPRDGQWARNSDNYPQTDIPASPGGGGQIVGVGEEDMEELLPPPDLGDVELESDLVVLDPDHPLMERFQKCLHEHLVKQKEKFSLELKELDESVRKKRNERENKGVQLYGVQQELARYQMTLEKYHDDFALTQQNREKEETQLGEVRSMYKDVQNAVNAERKKGAELQGEVENLALRLFYMENAKTDVRSDIAIMRRAAEKAESEVSKAEVEKQKQDLYVNRLVERADKLKEEIAMYEAQHTAQNDELKAAKDALMEAYMEIEAINIERKQLFQQWNSSLIGMKRRDEAHAAMNEALETQKMRILTLNMEVDGVKRSIGTEQETNEKLTLILNKTETDLALVRKQLNSCNAKHDALKAEYATYTRMLHETEQALIRANHDKSDQQANQAALVKVIEQEYLDKMKVEEKIMEKMQDQLLLDKSAQYSEKYLGKQRDLSTTMEQQLADEENRTAQESLNITNINARLNHLNKVRGDMDTEIDKKNKLVTNSELEIQRRMALVARKQTLIDSYNKKIDYLISSTGGAEIGPLELQINSMVKTLDAQQNGITENQQQWLRWQTDLVKLTKECSEQMQDIEGLKKRQMILSQKKIRNENEVDFECKEMGDIERDIRHMRNDIIKLNTLIFKQSGVQEDLERGNLLRENDFVSTLKDCELESLEMQNKLDKTREEKERLLNALVDAERHIMLWEKKTQLARETKATVDSDIGKGEMRAMKLELHRMQVRYTQLMKTQEKFIQEMEKAVSRRDTIVTKGDAQTKTYQNQKNVVTKGTFQRQLAETKKKIKQTIQNANRRDSQLVEPTQQQDLVDVDRIENANACDGEVVELKASQVDLTDRIEEKQINCQQLQSTLDMVDADIENLTETKQKNLTVLLAKQQKAKYYQQVKESKYTLVCKSSENIEEELAKHVEKTRAIAGAVDRLNTEYPHIQPVLRKATLVLATRTTPAIDEGSVFSLQ